MSNYNITLQTNNSSLEEIITQLNNMPDAGGGGTDTSDATAVASEIFKDKTAYGADGRLVGTFTIDNEISTQKDLISQISTLLDSKATPDIENVEQATPSITVNSSGLITATATQTAGYVAAGTKSATKQLAFQAAKTITPSTSNQIAVSSGYYTGGNITVAGDANLVASNIVSGKSIFGVVGTATVGEGNDPFATTTPFTYTVNAISGASYGFAINSDGYYESQNQGKNTSYAICRVNFIVTSVCDIVFDVINYAESKYDYALFGNLDSSLSLSSSADTTVKKSFKDEQSASVVNVTYSEVTVGNHYIDIKFIKDSSQNANNDSVQFKIQEQSSLSQETIDKILAADPDLVAENIKSGVNIFGISGSYDGTENSFPNGTEWTQSNMTTSSGCVLYANGIWVGLGSFRNGIYYSTNGKTWTKSNITNGSYYSIDYANGVWVVGGDNLYYSTDGKTWIQNNSTITLSTVYYANNIWVGGKHGGGAYYSFDGKSWIQSNLTDINCTHFCYGNGIFITGGNDDGIYYSVDGMTWTHTNITSGTLYDAKYANGIWVAGGWGDVGKNLYYSTDGITWTLDSVNGTYVNTIYYANGIWVLGSTANGIYYSTNGRTWIQSNLTSGSGNINSFYNANGIWVAGSSGYGVYYSFDGKSWIQSNLTSETINSFYNANGIWVASGGGIYYSVTWEPTT